MYKRLFVFLLIGLLTACSPSNGASTQQQPVQSQEISVVVATDIHYLATELKDHGELFYQMLYNSDSKQVDYIVDITDAFIEEVIAQKPNALILSGDLTFNGEEKSHQELAQKLKKISDSGVPVFVIPGNHDINNPYAIGFDGVKYYATAAITADGFKSNYNDFGYSNALYSDKNSLSYIAGLSSDLWVLMIDTSIYAPNEWEGGGRVGAKTLQWIKECLEKAKSEGKTVIAVTHHNLVVHNSIFFDNFVIDNSNELTNLLLEYGVAINFCGHTHAQNIALYKDESGRGIYDVAGSALSVRPNQYSVIKISPEKVLSYNVKDIDIEKWAKDNGKSDTNLLNFEDYSYQFFTSGMAEKSYQAALEQGAQPEEAAIMAELMVKINPAYFAGTISAIKEEVKNGEGYSLWKEYGAGTFYLTYINSVLEEEDIDSTTLSVELKPK